MTTSLVSHVGEGPRAAFDNRDAFLSSCDLADDGQWRMDSSNIRWYVWWSRVPALPKQSQIYLTILLSVAIVETRITDKKIKGLAIFYSYFFGVASGAILAYLIFSCVVKCG